MIEEKLAKHFYKSCYNKIGYRNRKKAEEFIDYQYKKFGNKAYLYNCKFCQKYHLTTKNNETKRNN